MTCDLASIEARMERKWDMMLEQFCTSTTQKATQFQQKALPDLLQMHPLMPLMILLPLLLATTSATSFPPHSWFLFPLPHQYLEHTFLSHRCLVPWPLSILDIPPCDLPPTLYALLCLLLVLLRFRPRLSLTVVTLEAHVVPNNISRATTGNLASP